MGSAGSVMMGGKVSVTEQKKKDMLYGTPVASLLAPADLIVFATIFTVVMLKPETTMTLSTGEFLVVGEGEVQVFVVNPGIDSHTGDNRVVLCTKRKSDIIWVPAVNRLVTELEESRRKSGSSSGGSGGGGGAGTRKQHKQLYRLLDNTSIKSFKGATLLKLDKGKYQRFIRDRNLDLATLHQVMESNIVDYLRQVRFLAKVPPSKLNVLSSMCNYEFKKTGQEVCREGELGAEVFLVIDGRLSVETIKNGQVLKLAELAPGQNFGELGALLRVRRIATVRALEPALLVSIKRHDFRSFLSINPELQAAIEIDVKFHLLRKYATLGHPLFPDHVLTKVDTPAGPGLGPLTSFSEVQEVEAGVMVMGEGEATQSLFMLIEGSVQVTFPDRLKPPESIHDGEIFGNCALLDGDGPERFTAVTQRPSVFLKIPRFDFFRFLGANPDISAALELRNLRRAIPLHRLLYLPAGKEAFYAHLQAEYSVENLEFYDAVEEIECMTSLQDVTAKAQDIWATYVEQGAPKQVNISDSQRTRIARVMGSNWSTGAKDAFRDAKREILLLMQKDNYARFKDKPDFTALLIAVDAAIPSAAQRLVPDIAMSMQQRMAHTMPARVGSHRSSMTTIDMAMHARSKPVVPAS